MKQETLTTEGYTNDDIMRYLLIDMTEAEKTAFETKLAVSAALQTQVKGLQTALSDALLTLQIERNIRKAFEEPPAAPPPVVPSVPSLSPLNPASFFGVQITTKAIIFGIIFLSATGGLVYKYLHSNDEYSYKKILPKFTYGIGNADSPEVRAIEAAKANPLKWKEAVAVLNTKCKEDTLSFYAYVYAILERGNLSPDEWKQCETRIKIAVERNATATATQQLYEPEDILSTQAALYLANNEQEKAKKILQEILKTTSSNKHHQEEIRKVLETMK